MNPIDPKALEAIHELANAVKLIHSVLKEPDWKTIHPDIAQAGHYLDRADMALQDLHRRTTL